MEVIRKHFDIIDSTNTWAKQNGAEFPKDKITLITANEQTAGRGRFRRRWESPPGLNVYATFCFFIEKHRHDIGNVPQILALSTAKTLEEIGFEPKLKWPNDVLLSGKKVGGILAETTPLSDQLCVVAGIGVNINMPKDLLDKIDRPATSLFVESGLKYDIETVLKILETKFCKDLDLFLADGFYPFLSEYKKRIGEKPGQPIKFNDNKTIWEGYFHSINNDGSLNLRLINGEIKTFLVGEIVWPEKPI